MGYPFLKLVGEAAAGNLSRHLVDEGDQAGQTREGWLKIHVKDTGGQITKILTLPTLSSQSNRGPSWANWRDPGDAHDGNENTFAHTTVSSLQFGSEYLYLDMFGNYIADEVQFMALSDGQETFNIWMGYWTGLRWIYTLVYSGGGPAGKSWVKVTFAEQIVNRIRVQRMENNGDLDVYEIGLGLSYFYVPIYSLS